MVSNVSYHVFSRVANSTHVSVKTRRLITSPLILQKERGEVLYLHDHCDWMLPVMWLNGVAELHAGAELS